MINNILIATTTTSTAALTYIAPDGGLFANDAFQMAPAYVLAVLTLGCVATIAVRLRGK